MSEADDFKRLTEKHKYLPCRDEEQRDKFFVPDGLTPKADHGTRVTKNIAEAKAMCSYCPILWQCMAEGIRIQDQWAVYGGLSPADRAALKKAKEEQELEELEEQELAA